jgi:hypothetical protein
LKYADLIFSIVSQYATKENRKAVDTDIAIHAINSQEVGVSGCTTVVMIHKKKIQTFGLSTFVINHSLNEAR